MEDKKSVEWRDRFETVWDPEGQGKYRLGSCGLRLIDTFLDVAKPRGVVNDYGSGTGRAAVKMVKAGLRVNCVDIATNAMEDEARALIGNGITFTHASLWDLPKGFPRAEYGFCADVLMTIPTERLELTLVNIRLTCETLFCEMYPWADVRCGYDLTATKGDADFWKNELSQWWLMVTQIPSQEDHRRCIFHCY